MFLLYALSVIVNLAPLIIVLIVNWEVCTKTRREGLAITVTGAVWTLFLIATMLGTLPHKVNRAVSITAVFLVLELMKPLLKYMCLFAGAAAIGAILDGLIIRPIIKRYAELRVASKTADLTSIQVKEAIKEAMKEERSGRV